jgi:uridine kinase
MAQEKIEITVKNTGRIYQAPSGTTLIKIMKDNKIQMRYRIMAATVDGVLEGINYKLVSDSEIEFKDCSDEDAIRIYRRGISFVLLKAAEKIFPNDQLKVSYSVSQGLYCAFRNGIPVITETDLEELDKEMRKIISEKLSFVRTEKTTDEAIEIFKKKSMPDKVRSLTYSGKDTCHLYYLGDSANYFYGILPPDTSYVDNFDLILMNPGLIIRHPTAFSPDKLPQFRHQVKLRDVFKEYETWAKVLNIEDVGTVNEIIKRKEDSELIKLSEVMHEKKISYIADMITQQFHQLRLILVAGPSSSGKTTFLKKLALYIKTNGLKLVQISMDNYFVDRVLTPKDADGNYDFERIDVLDLPLFNKHLSDLIAGKKIELPKFDFNNGKQSPSGNFIQIDRDQLILIEGIHALNDKLTYSISQDKKYKIYISPLTHLSFDNSNPVSSTDLRLMRRIIRDKSTRGESAEKTMKMWPSVRKGERLYIYPFLDDANVIFNSSLSYELFAVKPYIEKVLNEVEQSSEYYHEAKRLLNYMSYFLPINYEDHISPTSILREFIGGSAFEY